MKSIFGTAVTPYGICGFGYIDDNDLLQFLKNKQSIDEEGLKQCNITQQNLLSTELSKTQALEKVRMEIQNNQQLRLFLSRIPLDEQRKIVKEMLDAIMGIYR